MIRFIMVIMFLLISFWGSGCKLERNCYERYHQYPEYYNYENDNIVIPEMLRLNAKKNVCVDVNIYTYASAQLTNRDVANFNTQYPTLMVKKTQVFHDRFIILDNKTAYHIGASIKDAGKKCFGISIIDDPGVVTDLLNRLKTV